MRWLLVLFLLVGLLPLVFASDSGGVWVRRSNVSNVNNFDQNLSSNNSVVFQNINVTNSTIVSHYGIRYDLNASGNTTIWTATTSPLDGLFVDQVAGKFFYRAGGGARYIWELSTNGDLWTRGNLTSQIGYQNLSIRGETGLNLSPSANEACAFLYKPDSFGQTGLCFSQTTGREDIFRWQGDPLSWIDIAGNFHARTRVNTTTLQSNVLQSEKNDVRVNDGLNVSGNITGNQIYGFMFIHNESNADTPIDAANTYENITQGLNSTDYKVNGFEFVEGVGLQATLDGMYKVDYQVGFSQAGGAGDEWHISIGVDGVARDECHTPRKISTITDFGSAGSTCVISLVAGDVITAMIENQADADDANVMDMQVSLLRVGD